MRIFTFYRYLTVFLCLLLITSQKVFAQRIFATTQNSGASGVCVNCIVTGDANAADGNLQTYSVINVTVGLLAETHQSVIFPAAVAANTPVTLKLGTGDNLLDATVLGGILLQGYNGNTPVGAPVAAATLASALSNNNQVLVTFAPNQRFDRVRVTLDAGLLGAASSVYLYDAYYGTGAGLCNTAFDELHGVSSALLGLGLNVGGVVNPERAIDGNINTASTLNAGVALVGAFAQQTAIYNSPSVIGDSVRLTLSIPQALLDAGVLTGISVRTFNGNTNNNDERFLNSALLTVRLLDLTAGRRRVTVTYVPANVFDRVQLRLGGGIANALSSLDLYEIEHVIPKPVVTVGGVTSNSAEICAGSTVTLTATAVANTAYNWYTVPTGGVAVSTGPAYTVSPSVNTTYYVEAVRNGCTDGSARTAVAVTVNPVPVAAAVPTSTATICQGQTATFIATAVNGVTVNWYTAPTGGTSIFTGNVFTTPVLNANATYYAEALNANGCPAITRTPVTATVNTTPTAITLNPAVLAVNSGQSGTINVSNPQAGVTYNWYTVPNGGTIVHTGPGFTTGPLTANTTFYVEGILGDCSTPVRAQITIAVNSGPDVAVTPPTQAVNSGQTATFTATSTLPNATFDWYTAPTGGTSIFTGSVFTSPPVTTNVTYYAEAKNPATGAVSPTRASGAVTVNTNNGGGNIPNVTVTPPAVAVNAGETATFTASSNTAGSVFDWYTTPTGGASIFTGPTFTTPPVNANVNYYAEAKDPVSGNVSTTRATGSVTVNGGPGGAAPDVAVTPPVQSVNSNQTATFTASSTTIGSTFNWYTVPTGGASIFTGSVFTTPPVTANTVYYAEATSPTGVVSATRATGTVTVNAGGGGTNPDITVTPPGIAVNAGQTATFTASSTTPGITFYWYTTPTGGSPIFQGPNFTTPPVNGNVTYYAESKDPVSGKVSTVRATATVTVNPAPDVAVAPPSQSVNPGQTATFVASSTLPGADFNWYTTPTGGTAIHTGETFTTPPVNANVTYYAEAKNPGTGAVSATRATAAVTINPMPDVAVTPPSRGVNPGQTASFTASSTVPGSEFNWFTTPTGGTSIFTGNTFTTPPVNGNVTYFAEARNPGTGAVSATRATAAVTINPMPDVIVSPPTRAVNPGATGTFTATSTMPGVEFNWYTTPTGGTSIFTGGTFTTPPVNGNVTYYAEARNTTTGAVSPTRASAAITVNNAPTVTVVPPTAIVEIGKTATFTATSTTPGTEFSWYTTPSGGAPVFQGGSFTTPPVNGNVTYYVEGRDPSTGLISTRTSATVAVPPVVTIMPPALAVNPGATATFTATASTPGVAFNWYTTPSGGTPIFTGGTFTTPPVNGNVTYYAEGKDLSTGVVSTTRTPAAVTINTAPSITVVPPTLVVEIGKSGTFTAKSTTPGVEFNWYTTPTGGTPIYTGGSFVTPPVSGNIIYYVEAKNPSTGLTSPRTSASIVINVTAANIFIPNAFTPNADGKNDILYVYGPNLKNVKMWVYDQWGELQFQSNNQASGWDGSFKGRIQPVGVYVYYIEATLNDGNLIKKKGTVTLLR